MVSQNYLGSICEIKTPDNFLLASGFVDNVDETGLIIANRPDGIVPISIGLTVKVHIFNQQHGFLALSGTVTACDQDAACITKLAVLTGSEKRNYFRLYSTIAALLFKFSEVNGETIMDADVYEARIEDISLGGLQFGCEETFAMGDTFMVEFMVPSGSVSFNLRVCRVDLGQPDGNHYGCEFFDVSDRANERLCQFLFQKQRAQLQKL